MKISDTLIEYLHRKKVDVVFEINENDEGMKTYIIIFPVKEVKEQKYKNNLLPVVSYEIRYIKHKKIYTDTDWGLDYDYVLADKSTRIKRFFIDRDENNTGLDFVLSMFDIDSDDFKRPEMIDSALVNSPIDSYINDSEIFPHLWEEN